MPPRFDPTRCGNCGYSRVGLLDAICPECGSTRIRVKHNARYLRYMLTFAVFVSPSLVWLAHYDMSTYSTAPDQLAMVFRELLPYVVIGLMILSTLVAIFDACIATSYVKDCKQTPLTLIAHMAGPAWIVLMILLCF